MWSKFHVDRTTGKRVLKVDYNGKVNNTEAAEGMVEISSTFDHMFQFLFSVHDCGMPQPAAKQLLNILMLYCDEFKMTYV